jgi:hypothetical protein
MEDTNIEQVEQAEPSDRRAMLEAAFAEVETPEVEAAAPEVETPAEPVQEETAPVEAQETETPTSEPEIKIDRAPNSWKADEREAWEAIPESARRAIARRERDHQESLRTSADERKTAKEIKETLDPYRAEFQSMGFEPMVAVKGLLNDVYTLRRGDPQTKARLLANIVKNNNIDVGLLDAELTGAITQSHTPVQQQYSPEETQRIVREETQRTLQAEREAAAASDADRQVVAFMNDPKNEFLRDVHPVMQALLQSGSAKTLEQAYGMACNADDKVRSIIEKRKQSSNVQTKLSAAASVKGTAPRSPAPTVQVTARRALLSKQWDAFSADDKRV